MATLPPSPRQRQVWERIAMGKTSRQMAEEMRISLKTIDRFRCQLRAKLEMSSVADLTRAAVAHGVISVTVIATGLPLRPVVTNPPVAEAPKHKRTGFEAKSQAHDNDVLLAELELAKARIRKLTAQIRELRQDNRSLMKRMPRGF